MKNSNSLKKYLFLSILILAVFAGGYAFINRDKIMTMSDGEQKTQIEDNKNYSSSGRDDSQSKSDADIPPVYSSDNARDDYGLKMVSNYLEFSKILESELDTFFVFGRDGCHYCEMYEPVLKEVAALYKIEIVYVNMAALTPADYKNVLASGITIPAKCSKSGDETDISSGFGTPLSLFLRKGETYNCIRGYKDKVNLIKDLKEIGYVN